MIYNYGLYNYHDQNDKLVILFDEKPDKEEKINDEISIYKKNDEIVGYIIYNFIKYVKIKYSGIIFLPSDVLIDIINNILKREKLELLGYKHHSGYVVKENNNQKIIYAIQGTFLRDESISKGHICDYYDLDINIDDPHKVFVLDEDIEINKDFFQVEEK